MRDVALDQKKPWKGPGRDPRGDKFEDRMEEDEGNPDDDDGEDTYLDARKYLLIVNGSIDTTMSFFRGHGPPIYRSHKATQTTKRYVQMAAPRMNQPKELTRIFLVLGCSIRYLNNLGQAVIRENNDVFERPIYRDCTA